MTLSPCRTLQNVIHTQKCVPCREYAKPNRCVFKCFAKVSKPKEEDLKPTGKAFQLLGPATAKDLKPQSVRWLGTTMSPNIMYLIIPRFVASHIGSCYRSSNIWSNNWTLGDKLFLEQTSPTIKLRWSKLGGRNDEVLIMTNSRSLLQAAGADPADYIIVDETERPNETIKFIREEKGRPGTSIWSLNLGKWIVISNK